MPTVKKGKIAAFYCSMVPSDGRVHHPRGVQAVKTIDIGIFILAVQTTRVYAVLRTVRISVCKPSYTLSYSYDAHFSSGEALE